MSENAHRTAQVGFRKLAQDVGVPLVGDVLGRETGEAVRVDPEDEEQLAADAAERAAASQSDVRLDILVSRFKQNRLYEE